MITSTPAKAAAALAAQMRLYGPKKGHRGQLEFATTHDRVEHENGTPETRAKSAVERLAKADADIAAKAKKEQARTHAHQTFVEGHELRELSANAARCISVDDAALRALIRTAWMSGFNAGYTAGHHAGQTAD